MSSRERIDAIPREALLAELRDRQIDASFPDFDGGYSTAIDEMIEWVEAYGREGCDA